MLLIKGGRVIDPKTGMDQVQDIVIQDGIIKTIGQADQAEYDKVIDAS